MKTYNTQLTLCQKKSDLRQSVNCNERLRSVAEATKPQIVVGRLNALKEGLRVW